VLVSIGYAACHWCHVMAHESFEDEATAAVMNELFVNIKVDREERPDVDQVNMAALHALGQPGGWPLTMFLTPDGHPFWGGTYFPKTAGHGRPAFVEVLRGLAEAYRSRGADIASNAEAIRNRLSAEANAGVIELGRAELDLVATQLGGVMDNINGGLRGAPKFPNAGLLEYLWRASSRSGDAMAHAAFLLAMERICQGGIYDHIGGGFARYTVDERWLVPHFEKMLYDNAQLLEMLALAHLSSDGRPLFGQRARETVGWLMREMRQPGGAFASSLDADSEGKEGAFYVWRRDELDAVLGPEDAAFFAAHYDITPEGNWESVSIPNRLMSGEAGPEDEARLEGLRQKLLDAREKRPRPGLDDKVLADWNGLLITALARTSRVFGEPAWLAHAVAAFDFVAQSMSQGDRLGHSWRDSKLVYPGFATDLAAMSRAALALYEATQESRYLDHARAWLGALEAHYARPEGGYFLSADDAEELAVRPKATTDEAVASATGLALEALLRFAILTGEDIWRERVNSHFAALSGIAGSNVFGHLSVLNALDLRLTGVEVVVLGSGAGAEKLRQAALDLPFPIRTVLCADNAGALPEKHPARNAGSGSLALLCAGERCGLPTSDPAEIPERAAAMRQG